MRNQEAVPKSHWWQRKEIIIAVVISVLVLTSLTFAAHMYQWDSTTTTTTEVTQSSLKKVTTTETGKTLWDDWLQLLGVIAIPIVIAFGTAFFARQQAKTSEANAETQQQEELLRTYFDKISDLLLDKELDTNLNIQAIVRARTLAALHILSTKRKTIVLRFLHDAGLLQHVKGFLYELDLSNTDLSGIKLSSANLIDDNLSGAILWRTDLSEARLQFANLSGANLSEVNLSGADLYKANLSGARLFAANLSGAILDKVNLSSAIAIPEQFTKAKYATPEQLAQLKPSKQVTDTVR